MPPPDFDPTGSAGFIPPPPDGFQGDGGFFAPPDGFDPNGVLFVPPGGFQGDAVFIPPPPPDFQGDGFFFPPAAGDPSQGGFEAPPDFFDVYDGFPPPPPDFAGDWQPPPPNEWDGASDWTPPPPDLLYGDAEWFPPPPPQGWQGEWFPPPPPPPGLEQFPDDMFFSDKFQEVFTPELFADQGFVDGPPPFAEFPFDAYLADHPLTDIFPDAPPKFVPGAFGDFAIGETPPPPDGFLEFPPPPPIVDGQAGIDFAFDPTLDNFNGFVDNLNIPVPPNGNGPDAPAGVAELGLVTFNAVADQLPADFPLPEEAVARFDSFGVNSPLIGDDGEVNPELEKAFAEHPPVPSGFDALDFQGDQPQFDDMFTVYDADKAGETTHGQVMTTFSNTLEDGSTVKCSETTLLEVVQGEATPLIEMAPGVSQTQWTVNIRQQTSASFLISDPNNPGAEMQVDQSREVISQMTWTMVMKDVDTDGDGVPDKVQVSGSNVVDILSSTTDGELPADLPPMPPPPDLLLDLGFEGVLDLQAPTDAAAGTTPAADANAGTTPAADANAGTTP